MAYWGITVDDVKDELVILYDADASGNWNDARIENALQQSFKDVKNAMYYTWHEDYSDWDVADLAPDLVQRFIVLQTVWIISKRMEKESYSDRNYDPMEKQARINAMRVRNKIMQGEYVNERSEEIAKGFASSNNWLKRENVK